MKINEEFNILYRKANDEVTERTIIPTTIPASVVTALDVTGLDEHDSESVKIAYTQYAEYRDVAMKKLFNFTDWLDHTSDTLDRSLVKFRSFTQDKIV